MNNTIIDICNFVSKHITIAAKKIKPKSYNIDILYNNENFSIHTPLCIVNKIHRNDDNSVKSFDIAFKIQSNFKYYKFFNIFDLRLKHIVQNFNDKHKIIPVNTVNNLYKSGQSEYESLECRYITIHIKPTQETQYYNREKGNLCVYDIKEQDNVVALIYTKGIFMDSKAANYRWTALQIMKL